MFLIALKSIHKDNSEITCLNNKCYLIKNKGKLSKGTDEEMIVAEEMEALESTTN